MGVQPILGDEVAYALFFIFVRDYAHGVAALLESGSKVNGWDDVTHLANGHHGYFHLVRLLHALLQHLLGNFSAERVTAHFFLFFE